MYELSFPKIVRTAVVLTDEQLSSIDQKVDEIINEIVNLPSVLSSKPDYDVWYKTRTELRKQINSANEFRKSLESNFIDPLKKQLDEHVFNILKPIDVDMSKKIKEFEQANNVRTGKTNRLSVELNLICPDEKTKEAVLAFAKTLKCVEKR